MFRSEMDRPEFRVPGTSQLSTIHRAISELLRRLANSFGANTALGYSGP